MVNNCTCCGHPDDRQDPFGISIGRTHFQLTQGSDRFNAAWIPAYAGMTGLEDSSDYSDTHRRPGDSHSHPGDTHRHPGERRDPFGISIDRTHFQLAQGGDRINAAWIPACPRMTGWKQ